MLDKYKIKTLSSLLNIVSQKWEWPIHTWEIGKQTLDKGPMAKYPTIWAESSVIKKHKGPWTTNSSCVSITAFMFGSVLRSVAASSSSCFLW